MDPSYGSEDFGLDEMEYSNQCAAEIANGTFFVVSALAFLVAVFKVIKYLHIPSKVQVYVHVAVATITVAWFSSKKLESILIYNLFSIIFLLCAMKKVSGYKVLAGNIALLIFLQNICRHFKNEEYFLSIRGILMMHIMRLTTVAFHAEESTAKKIKFDQFSVYVEYVYFPPFLIFGPYMTLEQFTKMRNKKWTRVDNEFGVMIRASLAIFNGITLAIISSCHFEFFEPSSQFMEDALTAMSFRFSHYFVCFVTQAFVLLLGSDVSVASPFNVEFARSTVEIVSEWNKPFHTFLHENIFKRRFFNSTAQNVFFTFVVSALLHGRDYQMTVTLLALGFIAYSETVFRKRLAARFSMCIAAKPCPIRYNRRTCKHKHTKFSLSVILINLFFMALSMYHLVFTGMTFTDDYSSTGYPFSHAWNIWGSHYYASFVISFVFLLLSKVL